MMNDKWTANSYQGSLVTPLMGFCAVILTLSYIIEEGGDQLYKCTIASPWIRMVTLTSV